MPGVPREWLPDLDVLAEEAVKELAEVATGLDAELAELRKGLKDMEAQAMEDLRRWLEEGPW